VTVDELEHEADVHAGWQRAGVIMLGALSAAAASENAYSTTHTTVYTPHGSVGVISRTYDPAVAYQAGRDAGEMTGNGLAAIQDQLDRTLEGIHDNLLQTTTLAPGDSYGGIAIVDKLDSSKLPQMVSLQVNWNGENHLFRFGIADGEYAVPQQADTPAALDSQPVLPAIAATAAPALPLGHVSAAETTQENAAQENIAPVEVSAPVAYSEWQQENRTKAQGTSAKPRTGIVISGAVN
jgi:hypothetical protein